MGTSEKGSPRRRKLKKRPPDAFKTALLRNPLRAEILRILEHEPGLNKNQIGHRLGINMTAVDFHLHRMERAEIVATRSLAPRREVHCFTTENVALWQDPATRILFSRGAARQVAVYLAEHPGAASLEVAQALGLSLYTVRRNLRVLEERALVQRLRVENQVFFHAEPQLTEWIHEFAAERGASGP